MKQVGRVFRKGRERVRTETRSAAFDRRQKRANRLATDSPSMHEVFFQSDRIELTRNSVAFIFWPLPVCLRIALGKPPQQILPRSLRDRRTLELFPNWIDEPNSRLLPESRAKPESVLPAPEPRGIIRRAAKRHLWTRAGPFLIGQFRCVQADGIIKARNETVRVGN